MTAQLRSIPPSGFAEENLILSGSEGRGSALSHSRERCHKPCRADALGPHEWRRRKQKQQLLQEINPLIQAHGPTLGSVLGRPGARAARPELGHEGSPGKSLSASWEPGPGNPRARWRVPRLQELRASTVIWRCGRDTERPCSIMCQLRSQGGEGGRASQGRDPVPRVEGG